MLLSTDYTLNHSWRMESNVTAACEGSTHSVPTGQCALGTTVEMITCMFPIMTALIERSATVHQQYLLIHHHTSYRSKSYSELNICCNETLLNQIYTVTMLQILLGLGFCTALKKRRENQNSPQWSVLFRLLHVS